MKTIIEYKQNRMVINNKIYYYNKSIDYPKNIEFASSCKVKLCKHNDINKYMIIIDSYGLENKVLRNRRFNKGQKYTLYLHIDLDKNIISSVNHIYASLNAKHKKAVMHKYGKYVFYNTYKYTHAGAALYYIAKLVNYTDIVNNKQYKYAFEHKLYNYIYIDADKIKELLWYIQAGQNKPLKHMTELIPPYKRYLKKYDLPTALAYTNGYKPNKIVNKLIYEKSAYYGLLSKYIDPETLLQMSNNIKDPYAFYEYMCWISYNDIKRKLLQTNSIYNMGTISDERTGTYMARDIIQMLITIADTYNIILKIPMFKSKKSLDAYHDKLFYIYKIIINKSVTYTRGFDKETLKLNNEPTIKLLNNTADYVREHNEMHHCINTYDNRKHIIAMRFSYKGEWTGTYNTKEKSILYLLGKYNQKPSDEIKDKFKEIISKYKLSEPMLYTKKNQTLDAIKILTANKFKILKEVSNENEKETESNQRISNPSNAATFELV